MAEISTQAVVDAVTLALRAAYPDAVILDDDAPQGLQPGAFIVRLVSAGQRPMTGPRYQRTPLFDVTYFSADNNPDCVAVADDLSLTLALVRTPGGDLLHGSGMEWRVEDFVLHFIVGYPHFVLREEPQEVMETLRVAGRFVEGNFTKGGSYD